MLVHQHVARRRGSALGSLWWQRHAQQRLVALLRQGKSSGVGVGVRPAEGDRLSLFCIYLFLFWGKAQRGKASIEVLPFLEGPKNQQRLRLPCAGFY